MLEIIWLVSFVICSLEIFFGESLYSWLYYKASSDTLDIAFMIPPLTLVVFSAAVIMNNLHL